MFCCGVIIESLLYQNVILGQGQEKMGELFLKNRVYLATDSSSFMLAMLANGGCLPPIPNCSEHKWCKVETLERYVLYVHCVRDNANTQFRVSALLVHCAQTASHFESTNP